jgi:hypothetical protein
LYVDTKNESLAFKISLNLNALHMSKFTRVWRRGHSFSLRLGLRRDDHLIGGYQFFVGGRRKHLLRPQCSQAAAPVSEKTCLRSFSVMMQFPAQRNSSRAKNARVKHNLSVADGRGVADSHRKQTEGTLLSPPLCKSGRGSALRKVFFEQRAAASQRN